MLGRIGSGGMAEVFRARDEVLDREVAVKVFRAEHVARDAAHGLERQQLEVAALARLNHPNLITLYDGAIAPQCGPSYLVMELIDGPSLAARIAEGPLAEPAVREIGIQLADGLAYVHANGMVHRDVKPENILLGTDRSDDDSTVRARLSDFGIVRLLGSERLTSVNFTLGTASYLAPEQARGSDVDPPSDVYSLGLVLIEALTGVRSFDGPPLEAAVARLTTRPQVPADLPAPWPGLLHAMTEFEPTARPSAAEVARALRTEGHRSLPVAAVAVPVAAGFAEAPTGMMNAAAPSAAAAPAAATAAPRPARRRRPNGTVLAAALSLLVIATTLAIVAFTGSDSKSPGHAPPVTSTTPAADHPSASPTHHRSHAASTAPARPRTTSAAPTRSASSSKAAPSASSTSTAPRTSSAPTTSAPPPSRSTTSAPASSSAATTKAASNTPSSSTTAPPPSSSAAAPAAAASSTPVAGG